MYYRQIEFGKEIVMQKDKLEENLKDILVKLKRMENLSKEGKSYYVVGLSMGLQQKVAYMLQSVNSEGVTEDGDENQDSESEGSAG